MSNMDVLKKMGWLMRMVLFVLVLIVVGCGEKQPATPEPTPPGGRIHEPQTSGFSNQMLQIQNENHPNAIPGEYIVTFGTQSRSANKIEMTQARLAEARMDAQTNVVNKGGEITQEYQSFAGFSGKISDAALRELRTNPNVLSIEANVAVALDVDVTSATSNPEGELLSWGVDRIDGIVDSVYTSANNGQNVNVYVLDSGIDTTHAVFGGRAVNAFDVVGDGNEACGDHGTGVASIIGGASGVANGVTLYSVRVLDCNLIGSIADIISAVDWISENAQAPAVVNISVATYGSTIYNRVVENLINNGLTVVAAAGNDNRFDACDVSPAGATGVLTVGAVDVSDAIAWFNSTAERGCVNLYAPGVEVRMASEGNEYGTSSGTSFAAPHVAGCVARYLQTDPIATPADVMAAVEASATEGILTCDFGDSVEVTGLLPLDIDNDVPTAVSINGIHVNTNGIALALAASFVLLVTLWAKSRNFTTLRAESTHV